MTIFPDLGGEQMFCAICSRPLEELITESGRLFLHAAVDKADHLVVPVKRTDLASTDDKCDFCLADNPRWELNTNEFLGPIPGTAYDGDWLACDPCAELINRGLWSDLIRRAIEENRRHAPAPSPAAEAAGDRVVRDLLKLIRRNVTRNIHRREDI